MHFSHYSLKRHQDFVSLWQGETFINTTNTADRFGNNKSHGTKNDGNYV